MKDITLTYKRNGVEFRQFINSEYLSKLVREKVKNENFEEFEAILFFVDQLIAQVPETPDDFIFEYIDDNGLNHTFFGNFKN